MIPPDIDKVCIRTYPNFDGRAAMNVQRLVRRVNKLIREVQRDPFSGIGKPELLKNALAGYW
jgi:Txe/YoeB family toxin of Txe-Axe toxin-antitoxin module